MAQSTNFIVLGDGRRVYHALDLSPAVAETSATAEAGRRSQAAARSANIWYGVALGVVCASAAMLAVSAADDTPGPGPLSTIGLLTFGGGIGLTWVAISHSRVAHDERVSAFATYDRDLRARLELCVEGTRLVPCPAGLPAVAPVPSDAPPVPPAPPAPQPVPASAPSPPSSSAEPPHR